MFPLRDKKDKLICGLRVTHRWQYVHFSRLIQTFMYCGPDPSTALALSFCTVNDLEALTNLWKGKGNMMLTYHFLITCWQMGSCEHSGFHLLLCVIQSPSKLDCTEASRAGHYNSQGWNPLTKHFSCFMKCWHRPQVNLSAGCSYRKLWQKQRVAGKREATRGLAVELMEASLHPLNCKRD